MVWLYHSTSEVVTHKVNFKNSACRQKSKPFPAQTFDNQQGPGYLNIYLQILTSEQTSAKAETLATIKGMSFQIDM